MEEVTMQKVERHIIRDNRFSEWCVKSKNLYNQSLYYWRQSMFGNIQEFSQYDLMKVMQDFNDENFRALPANTSQQIIKVLFKNIKSWNESKKEYQKNPSKFCGTPSMPKYKKKFFGLYFTYNQVKLKNGLVHFPSMMGVPPMKTKIQSIDCCRVIPKSNHFVVEFVYTVKCNKLKEDNGVVMGIDLGVSNLATCVINTGYAFIIGGNQIKSTNAFCSKRKAKLQSALKDGVYSTKRIERLEFRRNNRVKDYIHKSSSIILHLAIKHGVSKIIIGNNVDWKRHINIGKRSNQNFTSIPHGHLIKTIEYKAKIQGILMVLTEESYTSKCSSLDLEPMIKHKKYLGNRAYRGLFKTSNGTKINADANGAANIIRKVLGNEFNPDPIRSCLVQPYKINANNFVKSF